MCAAPLFCLKCTTYWNFCFFIFVSRHSDVNLAVMDSSSNKGEDQVMLLEEGVQAPVQKPVYASLTSQMFRLFVMYDFSFMLYINVEISTLLRH